MSMNKLKAVVAAGAMLGSAAQADIIPVPDVSPGVPFGPNFLYTHNLFLDHGTIGAPIGNNPLFGDGIVVLWDIPGYVLGSGTIVPAIGAWALTQHLLAPFSAPGVVDDPALWNIEFQYSGPVVTDPAQAGPTIPLGVLTYQSVYGPLVATPPDSNWAGASGQPGNLQLITAAIKPVSVPVPIPEMSAVAPMALVGLGGLGYAAYRRRIAARA